MILLLPLFTNAIFVDATHYKTAKTKDIRELKKPTEDKTVKITNLTKSRTLAILYIITVEVCAGREKLYSPELDLKSDRDSMTVKVAGLIMPKSCKSAEFFIRANDPDSISVGFATVSYREIQRT